MACRLPIIVTTPNEQGKTQPLLENLDRALKGMSLEIILPDDDSSERAAVVGGISYTRENVHCLPGVEHRGFSLVCVEGHDGEFYPSSVGQCTCRFHFSFGGGRWHSR